MTRGTEDLERGLAIRIRGFNRFLLFTTGVAAVFVAVWIAAGAWPLAGISSAWCFVAATSRFWVLRRPDDVVSITGATMGATAALVFVAAMISGQGHSPLIVFLVVMPALSAYTEGTIQAILWSLTSAALVALLHLSEVWFPLPGQVPMPAQLDFLAYTLGVFLVGFIAVVGRRGWDETRLDLAAARDEALAASDQRMKFLSRMSHEIRTPLHGAIGMTEVLLGTELDEHQREAAEIVRRSANGLVEVVDRVLDLVRLDAGALELASTEFDLLDVVEDTLELFATASWERRVRLGTRIDPDVPTRVLGDPLRTRQVLVNLVGNAMKFTREGSVVVSVSTPEPGRIAFAVSDTGSGIDAAALKKLFQPFWQVSVHTAAEHGGSGLGLALSRQLARVMGGDVQAASTPGEGSTFVFTAELRPVASEPAAPAGTALLLDPDPEVGTFVTAARAVGLDVARGPSRPDWIVVHAKLPALAESLVQARERAPDAIPVLLTSLADDTVRPRAAELGFQHVLYEPVRRRALRALIAEREPSEESPRALSPLRVLVVDDNPVNRRIAALMVGKLGMEHEAVDNGDDAVTGAQSGRFQVVLMDVMMPGLSGIEAAQRIRESMERPPIIIALSANNLEEQKRECLAAGMVAHLDKPLRIEALAEVLREHAPALSLT
ncbi:MAG: response regulator [Alphaproteobacteria bacterium]|nr:response regulator [Alphaproteobacteria bacterium]